MDVQIEKVENHYGFITAWVAPYRTTDHYGNEVEVTEWYVNGCLYTAEGFKVKKDGTLYARKSSLSVKVPANVQQALDSFSQD